MFGVGDYVTRKSYNNDIVFKVIDIRDNIYYLKGVNFRLYADSPKEDLVVCEDNLDSDKFSPSIDDYRDLDRNEYFYLPGKILHIDGDEEYLEKCMNFYNKSKIKAYGLYLKEDEFAISIGNLLKKYNPDILVLTGHDAFYRKKRNKYKNTSNFVDAVMEARKYEKSHEKLLIIAGACQSCYKIITRLFCTPACSTATPCIFSSPISFAQSFCLSIYLFSCLSFSDKNTNIDLIKILDKTKYGASGIGGIITKGTMYVGYPR